MNILAALSDILSRTVQWVFTLFGNDERVAKVQELVLVGCGFLPTATSVAGMFSVPNPTVTGVLGIAVAICHAVKNRPIQSLADLGVYGEVNGVPVEGEFVGEDKK